MSKPCLGLVLEEKCQETLEFLDVFPSKDKDLIFVLEEEGVLPYFGGLLFLFFIFINSLMVNGKLFLFSLLLYLYKSSSL